MSRKKLLIVLIAALAISGAAMVAHSGYFYARGLLAQILLERAWEECRKTKEPVMIWQRAGTYPVGKLRIKSIGLSRVVLNGIKKESLKFGPAHVPESAVPGERGNIAIAAHRDSFFRNLKQVKRGEVIELESISSVQYFKVTEIQITDPSNTHWAENTGNDLITLITCYPFDYVGAAPKRYIVRGRLYKKIYT